MTADVFESELSPEEHYELEMDYADEVTELYDRFLVYQNAEMDEVTLYDTETGDVQRGLCYEDDLLSARIVINQRMENSSDLGVSAEYDLEPVSVSFDEYVQQLESSDAVTVRSKDDNEAVFTDTATETIDGRVEQDTVRYTVPPDTAVQLPQELVADLEPVETTLVDNQFDTVLDIPGELFREEDTNYMELGFTSDFRRK